MAEKGGLSNRIKDKLSSMLTEILSEWGEAAAREAGSGFTAVIKELKLISSAELLAGLTGPYLAGVLGTPGGSSAAFLIIRPADLERLPLPGRTQNIGKLADSIGAVLTGPDASDRVAFRCEVKDEIIGLLQDLPERKFARAEVSISIPPGDDISCRLIIPYTTARHWADIWKDTSPVHCRRISLPEWQGPDVPDGGPQPPHRAFREVPVGLKVVLGRIRVPLARVMELCPGAFLPLNSGAEHKAELMAANHSLARGEIVVVNDRFGLLIKEVTTMHDGGGTQ